MLFRKTPATERSSYVYRFADGTKSVITESDEAAVWIRTLQGFDNHEAYNNVKNCKPTVEGWQKKAMEEWNARHPEEQVGVKWNLSLDYLTDEDPETDLIEKEIAWKTAEASDPLKELLYEQVDQLSEEEQELYCLYFIEGFTQEEIAAFKHVSTMTISRYLRKLSDTLTVMCRKKYKKFPKRC